MDLNRLLDGVPHMIIQRGSRDDAAVTSLVTDSRKVAPGCMYVCIRGLRVDGHRFIKDACDSAAAAIMIDEPQPHFTYPPELTVIQVEHSRKALSRVAANFYGKPAEHFCLAGVTGTNGKTSTANFLEMILEHAGHKTGLIGTVSVRVGKTPVDVPFETSTTPDPLELQQILACMRDMGARDVVMEVSSHALALHKVEGMTFNVGIFTNLTQDHLDFHGTMENYRDAKARFFAQVNAGVLNADDPVSAFIMEHYKCNWLTYGIKNECDLCAVNITDTPEGSSFDVEIDGARVHFFLPVKGRFNIYNSLAAIGAALSMDIPVAVIKEGVAAIHGIPGRVQPVLNDKGLKVLVDYAHSPDGLINIINAVREFTSGRVITLFGCGGDKDRGKRPMMGRIAGELSDYCIITSDNPRNEPPDEIIKQIEEGMKETNCPYECHVNRREAIFAGVAALTQADTLIIAGKGHEQYQIIGNETLPFDDADVAQEALV
jgi:UDP-N-acetylmuramoyl-L-alanyl-D-glutamate--2,6-diaminopimelate ligase